MYRWVLYNVDTDEYFEFNTQGRNDPQGWDELLLTLSRDEKWHGVTYEFTKELGFYCDGGGKEFVDAAYDSKGQEAYVRLSLYKKERIVVEGKLNYSEYRQEYKSNVLYTFLNVENDNPLQTLKNREDTPVDLLSTTSLNGTTLNDYTYLNYDLTLHGRLLKLVSKWENEGDKENGLAKRFPTGASSASMVQTPDILSVFTEITETPSFSDQSGQASVGFGTTVPALLNPKIDLNGSGYTFPMTVVIDYDFDGDFTDEAFDTSADPPGSGVPTATSRDTGIVGSGIFLRMWIGEEPGGS